MRVSWFLLSLLLLLAITEAPSIAQRAAARALTVVALGNTGEAGGILRGNASYVAAMLTGEHDAGPFDVMLFLGNTFGETGLNVPTGKVESTVRAVLGQFDGSVGALGREHVHALPGNNDYYARYASEEPVLFGLFTSREHPTGLSDRGNERAAAIDRWTYHYQMPSAAQYPLSPGAPDSVQFLFFDSALLLRTPPAAWRPALDSLRQLLRQSVGRRFAWRVLCTHHPLQTVGEHGGYSVWEEEDSTVRYLSPCDRDTNAAGWLRNWIEADDMCAERYRALADSLTAVVSAGGAPVHLMLSAHDRSLQLLYRPNGAPSMPKVYVVSGAASSVGRVKLPSPPNDFTSAQREPAKEGFSLPGFVQLRFDSVHIRVAFVNGRNGDLIDMGGGRREFLIDREGNLEQRP